MTRVIGIVGAPASGKTTLMRAVRRRLGTAEGGRFGLLRYEVYTQSRCLVLGVFRPNDPFPGSDRLPGRATDYARLLFRDGHQWLGDGWTVLWDGPRFARSATLTAARDLTLWRLVVPAEQLELRHAERMDNQSPRWLAGMRRELAAFCARWPVTDVPNATPGDLERNTEALLTLIEGSAAAWTR